jgi:hypothetical protein
LVSSTYTVWFWNQSTYSEKQLYDELPKVLKTVNSPHFLSLKLTQDFSQPQFLNIVDAVLSDSPIEPSFTIFCSAQVCVLELESQNEYDREELSTIIHRIMYKYDDMVV